VFTFMFGSPRSGGEREHELRTENREG
jgi:hypothetical protein